MNEEEGRERPVQYRRRKEKNRTLEPFRLVVAPNFLVDQYRTDIGVSFMYRVIKETEKRKENEPCAIPDLRHQNSLDHPRRNDRLSLITIRSNITIIIIIIIIIMVILIISLVCKFTQRARSTPTETDTHTHTNIHTREHRHSRSIPIVHYAIIIRMCSWEFLTKI